MDTASCRDSASSAGYGASQPHASLSQYHDSASFVAAIAATFGEGFDQPAPVSQIWHTPSDVASEIAAMLESGDEGSVSTVPLVGPKGAPGEGGALPSLDLIEGHKSETTRILVKTESYPAGSRRVLVRQVSLDQDPVIVGGRAKREKREKSQQERVDSSIQRTRKVIRQRCMAFKCDRLLTLTYRENVTDRRRAYRDMVRFIERCRQVNLLPRYVAVAEQQKRGAWHVHIACRGYMAVMTLRRIWREIVGEFEGKPNGNIDLSYRHRGHSNPWRIAAYLSKYIGKAIEQAEPGERTFWASEWGGQEPITRIRLLPPGLTLTQVQTIVAGLLEQSRLKGSVAAIDTWHPRGKDGKPPDLFVFWAA